MKPILFNTDMVRAILEGRKTVTRRVVNSKPLWRKPPIQQKCHPEYWANWDDEKIYKAPYRPGDILYVRETSFEHNGKFYYKADGKHEALEKLGIRFKWHPSIHMPREAARIFLRVTDVRVEQLQDITPEKLRAEGMHLFLTPSECKSMMNRFGAVCDYERKKKDFSALWDSTIKPTDRALYGWNANPWVWVIAFERISKEEAYGT